LALDKALSQILKLTVDYEALRTRVEFVDATASNESDGWFLFGNSGGVGEDKLQELLALNAKRLADRDQQIATLQNRLAAVQKRYDSENVSRLLAEKRLKIIRDKDKTSNKKGSVNSDKLRFLTELLEKNQRVIRQLKIELTDEKLKYAKLASEKTLPPVEPGQPSGVKGSASPFNPAQEWVVKGLKFKQGSVDLELDSTRNLKVLIEHLTQNSKLNIQINGYTDSVGSADFNLRLSQARADSVADYLVQQGIPFDRIKSLGYGEQKPLADNQLEQGRQRNRRVAILFLN
jgi:outer membrane protein OmpA-like peptidoglycan-associated protein